MEPKLLDYYTQELVYMRKLSEEFARAHPKVAKRLGMETGEIRDPYVERMIEAFCFMAARIQLKLDAEFPRFTARLLEVINPNYLAPTPSMAVARLYPGRREGNLMGGLRIPQGTSFVSHPVGQGQTACRFRSSQDVTLWPLRVVSAHLTSEAPDLGDLIQKRLPSGTAIRGVLRLRLATLAGERIAELEGLDRLPVYLSGDEQIASHLFELIHVASVASVVVSVERGSDDRIGTASHVIHTPVEHEGLSPEQSLLPLHWKGSHGSNLLQEYFVCPERFWFFTLAGLADGLKRVEGSEVEIVLLLHHAPGRLAGVIDASHFALFCTPVINLFRRPTAPVDVATPSDELHVVPTRMYPEDFEIFSIDAVRGQLANGSQDLVFRSLYETLQQDAGNYGRYFSVRRERRRPSDSVRRTGTRSSYIGTEVYLSLVDQHDAPYSEKLRHLAVDAWMTNRDLPLLLARDGKNDLTIEFSAPLEGIGFIRPPSAPRPPYADGEHAWRLIRQLGFNHFPIEEANSKAVCHALRDMLRLHVAETDHAQLRQIESLESAIIRPITRRLPGPGPLVFGRGIQCTLTVDEGGFSGDSPFLLGLLLERWIARQVSINSFTEMHLHSAERGVIARWPARSGTRGIL